MAGVTPRALSACPRGALPGVTMVAGAPQTPRSIPAGVLHQNSQAAVRVWLRPCETPGGRPA